MSTRGIVAPRLLLVGGGASGEIASVFEKLELRRPLIVTDPFMISSKLVEHCTAPLANAGIPFRVFGDTVSDPTDTVVDAGIRVLLDGDYDCIIGFGGGSPIDTAK